ncbi:Inner membrane protein alx [Raoultella terrigena]|uniref:Inner membrane protein alx n=1 Tax=Raoultella terrigena TaxID=577 RepID=A0A4U9D3S5_RAOTE|nr:Inner membrane protein alx [Raoultella terrigena]
MYFLLAGVAERFSMLKYGLSIILVFIGIKMLIVDFYHIPIGHFARYGRRDSGADAADQRPGSTSSTIRKSGCSKPLMDRVESPFPRPFAFTAHYFTNVTKSLKYS